jgi:thiol-disulfide isomerase/thioredoxin
MRKMFFNTSAIMLAAIFLASGAGRKDLRQELAPLLSGATGWLNSQPLKLDKLGGKVVLINFCTYTCINWLRTLPYIREWENKYRGQGLVVIGVHTPEFSFEHKLENVRQSIKKMNISYPVALDNNYSIWDSFRNQYWPALYLFDARGKLRYQKFGEGEYEEIELAIQQLLQEISGENASQGPVTLQPEGYEAAPDWENLRSAETYMGYSRSRGFVSPGEVITDKQANFSVPARLNLNRWGLSGRWIIGKEHARAMSANGKIIYRFHARDLHLVMGPDVPGHFIKFRVLIDGNPPGPAHGLDIDSNGYGTVTDQRMYQLIRQPAPVMERQFQIEFFEAGVEAYNFTFG